LLNLLNNAIKFTPQGTIELSLKSTGSSAAGERLQFSVIDTGIGIPASKLDRLFERFSQVDSSISRQYGGTGLGLAISKRLVDLMGGQIGVHSEPGQGSTFWFCVTLPRSAEHVPAEEPVQYHLPTPPGRHRILLAEDVEINQEIARSMLEKAGYAVDVAANGAEAVRAVQNGSYDVVLMDVQMPEMDGLQATEHIRALSGPVSRIPIIAMTANVYAEQVASFIKAGMNDHVGKPFKRDALLAAVARWLPTSGGG
jgi:CheY-like chemotaxis protein